MELFHIVIVVSVSCNCNIPFSLISYSCSFPEFLKQACIHTSHKLTQSYNNINSTCIHTHTLGDKIVLVLSVSTSILIFVIVVMVSAMVTAIVLLAQAKLVNRRILKELNANSTAIYDEIANKSPPGSPGVDTEKNVAYETVHVMKVVSV